MRGAAWRLAVAGLLACLPPVRLLAEPPRCRPDAELRRLQAGLDEALGQSQASEACDPAPAQSAYDQADQAFDNSDYDRARRLFDLSLAWRERALGPGHVDVARTLIGIAALHGEQGRYDEARATYLRARSLLERLDDEEWWARLEGSIAVLDLEIGAAAAARERLEPALARAEARLGPEHPYTAMLASNLGLALDELGDWEAAQARYEQALRVREKVRGPEHPSLINTLNNLGSLRRALGDYAGARAAYERALAVAEKSFAREHPRRADILHNLANLRWEMGDSAAARPLAEESLAIQEKVYGPEHAGIPTTLVLLAVVLEELGELPPALELTARALALQERVLGPDHRDLASVLYALGRLRRRSGDLPAARAALERSLAVAERGTGPDTVETAQAAGELAQVLVAQGEPARARALAEQALAIRRRRLGEEHPLTAESRGLLARRLASAGKTPAALDEALLAEQAAREHFRLTVRTLGERQALLYSTARASGLDVALELLQEGRPEALARAEEVLDAVVRSRGLVLDEMARRRHAVVHADSPELRRQAERLGAVRDRLALLAARGPQQGPERAYVQRLAEARAAKERAERELAAASASFRDEQRREQAGLADVVRALPEGSALVSIVKHGEPGAYLAFVVRPPAVARVVALGPAPAIEGAVAAWRAELQREAGAGGRDRRRNLTRYEAAAGRLRRLAWDPIATALGAGVGRVHVAPDGALQLVNLAALPDARGRYLVEGGPALHVLTSERDLLPDGAARGRGLLALGAPDFDHAGSAVAGRAASPDALRSGGRTCSALAGLRFGPLPGAAAELAEVAALFARHAPDGDALERLDGRQAGEEALRRLAPGRRFLHLATHGFFAAGGCAPAEGLRPPADEAMLRSGLALAGANRAARQGDPAADGLVTAEELAGLDLEGLEWAVLSACESGLGSVADGEGVFGLQRAFRVAGARTLVMSLWPVADQSAARFVPALYRERLERGQQAPEAVAAASRAVLRARRAAGLSPHPFYWAAFISAGRP